MWHLSEMGIKNIHIGKHSGFHQLKIRAEDKVKQVPSGGVVWKLEVHLLFYGKKYVKKKEREQHLPGY